MPDGNCRIRCISHRRGKIATKVLHEKYIEFPCLAQLTTSTPSEREKLSRAQEEFVRSLEVKVFTLLRETPPHGDAFVGSLIRLLKREDQWSQWKNDGCKSVERPAGGDEVCVFGCSVWEFL